jgi:excisionase family DNA binding protein
MSKSARVRRNCQADPAKAAGTRRHRGLIGSQKQPNFDPSEWISQATAAKIRKVSRQAIAKLVRKRKFSTLAIGGRVLLKRSDVERYRPAAAGRPSQ